MLLSLLAHPVPFHVYFTPEDTGPVLGKDNHNTANILSHAHMGIHKSAPK